MGREPAEDLDDDPERYKWLAYCELVACGAAPLTAFLVHKVAMAEASVAQNSLAREMLESGASPKNAWARR